MTLPLVYALREASSREKTKALDILKNDDFKNEGFKFIMDIVEKYKGVQQTKKLAKEFANKAKNTISGIPENECKKSLDLLADYVAERRK